MTSPPRSPNTLTPETPTTPRVEDVPTAQAIVTDELQLFARVSAALGALSVQTADAPSYDAILVELRDQIAEAKPEDLPTLVEQMTRTAALAQRYGQGRDLPVDPSTPYFAHLRLAEGDRQRDILLGKRGYINRGQRVQIVDWRNAPISRIYYRYDEGDDYEERFGNNPIEGIVSARRSITIDDAHLQRIGCPQGTFAITAEGTWVVARPVGVPELAGGQGKAARPPALRRGDKGSRLGIHSGSILRADKHLPEIAALIDPQQFDLITHPGSGLVVLQGGAGTGKTTVALHRIAYLNYHAPQRFRADRLLVIVPSRALVAYVTRVLPALGVRGVRVVTAPQWFGRTREKLLPTLRRVTYADDTPATVLRLKKHPLMLRLLKRAVVDEIRAATRALADALDNHPGGDRVLAAWHENRHLPPIPRLLAIRRYVRDQKDLPTTSRQAVESFTRNLLRNADDLVTLWSDALTDRARLGEIVDACCPDTFTGRHLDAFVTWCAKQATLALARDDDSDNPTPRHESPRANSRGRHEDRNRDGHDRDRFRSDHGRDREGPGRALGADGREIDDDDPRGRLDPPDDALLLHLCLLQRGELRGPKTSAIAYEHLAVDEAQDLSVVELKVLLEATTEARSVTLAGDTAQRLVFDNAFSDWETLLRHLDAPEATNTTLELGYRSTHEVISLAQSLLLDSAPPAAQPTRTGAPVELHRVAVQGEAVALLADALRALVAREPLASVALIARYRAQAKLYADALILAEVPNLRLIADHDFSFRPGIDVTHVAQVKGLEFDYVILLDVNAANYPDTLESRHLLHIAATRAAHQLWLIAVGPPSPILPPTL